MRMKALRIALAAFVMAALVSQAVLSDEIWTERKLTSGAGGHSPEVWGNTVYWVDSRLAQSGYEEIRAWDAASGERVVMQVPLSQYTGLQSVYQDTLLYTKYVGSGDRDLYVWDPLLGERAISIAPGYQYHADIYGDTVVWEDRRGAKSQVYIWDPVNGERPISPTAYGQIRPRIWGDTVVWEDDRNGRRDVYMWNPRDGERRLSTALFPMMSPAIYQDRVVMCVINDPYAPWNEPGIWEWTPQGGLSKVAEIFFWDVYDVVDTRLWGDLVVWQCGGGPSDVLAWDPVHGVNRVNQSALGAAFSPSLYGNTVAWTGYSDVYVSTLVPEPSGLITLLGWAGFLALTRRRRLRKA